MASVASVARVASVASVANVSSEASVARVASVACEASMASVARVASVASVAIKEKHFCFKEIYLIFYHDQILLSGPVFNQLRACIMDVIFFAFFAGERRQALVSEKRQTRPTGKQKKQRPVHIPLFCCIPPHTYSLMALLTRFAPAFAPASGLIAFARPKNARLLCRLAS